MTKNYIEIDGLRYRIVKEEVKVKTQSWHESYKEWKEVYVLELIEPDGYKEES
jgi:hypothetical protein